MVNFCGFKLKGVFSVMISNNIIKIDKLPRVRITTHESKGSMFSGDELRMIRQGDVLCQK